MQHVNSALIIAVASGAHLPWWVLLIIIAAVLVLVFCIFAILEWY